MLHEILLSLAGNPSPLLRADAAGPDAVGRAVVFSPPERELLASASHLSGLHVKLLGYTAQISSSHPSTVCRAVAASILSVHLAAFQRKVLEVEEAVLRRDAGLVGAYNIVPLTAVVGEFSDWTRRLEWLWDMVQLMLETDGDAPAGRSSSCTGAGIINRLRAEMQTGYVDIEATATSLVAVAETAWLKQVSTWILYGRLPSFGIEDFFVHQSAEGEEEVACRSDLLPSFVSPSTASSMLFIGASLSYIRGKSIEGTASSGLHEMQHLSSQLAELSQLTHPLDSAALARTVTKIRRFLSKNILQRFLPLAKVVDILQLLRDFFLLGRGEFAMALTQQADEKVSSRWRRADNLAYERPESLRNVMVKEGEVVAVLSRTWGALGSLQGQHSDEDEGLERARDLIRLDLAKTQAAASPSSSTGGAGLATTPFRNLLFGVPVALTLQVSSPLDLFLGKTDLQTYTAINAYLLSIRRAHIRLTNLWKISSLRRHYPPPPRPPYGSSARGWARVRQLRGRHKERSNAMRSAWATSSAAIFFLAESEAYLQTEVVAGLWDGFHQWLVAGTNGPQQEMHDHGGLRSESHSDDEDDDMRDDEDDGDIWLAAADGETESSSGAPDEHPKSQQEQQRRQPHDPQTLATAHRLYLFTLSQRLLLTHPTFTRALYEFLVDVDHLIGKIHRLHDIWNAMDLEEDAGVVDAFVDLEGEELDVKRDLLAVERRIKAGVEACVAELRRLEASFLGGEVGGLGGEVGGLGGDGAAEFAAALGVSSDGAADGATTLLEPGAYVPRRVGGLDRLLMKLDFGTWFESSGPGAHILSED